MRVSIFNMCRAAIFIGLFLSALFASAQQSPSLLVDIDHRAATSLNGPWHYIVDPYHGGWGSNTSNSDAPSPRGYAKNRHYVPGGPLLEYDFAQSPVIQVPGDWNSQKENLFYYEGLLWYQHDFDYHPKPHTHVFLHIGAANYAAHVFVNDVHVCDHEGGFTPFDCEITSATQDGGNFVVIAVDNGRALDHVPTIKSDWWNYGGLTRDVSLVEVPETFIDDESLHLTRGGEVEGYVHVVQPSPGMPVKLSIPGLHIDQSAAVGEDGTAKFSFRPSGLEPWSPEDPHLYKVEFTAGGDHLTDEIGFRTVEVQGDQILLNGKPVFLRGVSVHAEAPYRSGRAWSDEDAKTLLNWAQELHCNFIRLAHYPHDERMTRLADKMGILVWSEIPVYWSIDWASAHTLEVAKQQLHEMIRRDHNKASVILWSMSNETPITDERTAFIRKLVAQARQEDPTRLITSAMLTPFHGKTAVLDDPLGADLDVLGYNEYIGWYMGKPEDAPTYKWEDPMNKPVIISEFGGGAKAGLHGPADQRFTEEYEAEIFKQQFAMFRDMPFLRGISPWVLMDFRSPTRLLPGIQDGYNRKGLISDKGEKKKAFFVLQDYYAHMQQP
ncbi:MAG TPA: glycoside hydrolase family 2 TIM barrel-domain containing protein [Silvibacterium sp.]|nr:glycoside hydrolase family 2 TIM barrel-domain containing protein [Silvibacterium sp.]